MKTFTSEERNLMYLYNSGTRLELIDNLTDMRSYLQADETELLTLTDCVLEKLRQKTVTPHGYGIGLLNIEKRLEFAFGKEAGLELYNEDGMATARITIPCRVS